MDELTNAGTAAAGTQDGAAAGGVVPDVSVQPDAQAGRPDNVWANHRRMEKVREIVEGRGYDFNEFMDSIQQLPEKSAVMNNQQPTYQQDTPYTEAEDFVTKREAAMLYNELQQTRQKLNQFENLTASERMERETQATGLTPTLQRAYRAIRQSDPDADPAAIVRELKAEEEQIFQRRLQAAKANQDQLTPNLNAQNPTLEGIEPVQESGKAGWKKWTDMVKSGLGSQLGNQ